MGAHGRNLPPRPEASGTTPAQFNTSAAADFDLNCSCRCVQVILTTRPLNKIVHLSKIMRMPNTRKSESPRFSRFRFSLWSGWLLSRLLNLLLVRLRQPVRC
jgi:hypothetical protein